jgi:Flp pilus assembly protein TadG
MKARQYKRGATAGTVALEFGLLAIAFLGLLLGIFELGFLLFAQISLDYAATEAARSLLTGQTTIKSGANQQVFQSTDFCAYLSPLITCSGVIVVLQPVVNYQTTLTNDPPPTSTTTVNPGGPGSLMLLQAYYTPGIPVWPLNVSTLIGTAAFVNEY